MSEITIVSYKVKVACVAENKKLILTVINKLPELNPQGLQYASTIADDDQTFTPVFHASNTEHQGLLPNLGVFKAFQKYLMARCEVPPKPVIGSIVDNFALFN